MSAPAAIVGPPTLTSTIASVQNQNQQQAQNGVNPGASFTGYVLLSEQVVITDSVSIISATEVSESDSVSLSDTVATATGPGEYNEGSPFVYGAGAYNE